MRKLIAIAMLAGSVFCAFCAETNYKQVLITSATNCIRVRLPLTDVTGKVRVKQQTPDGFGLPVAPSKTVLDARHYLEWQIGYDTPDANSVSIVPQIHFTRKGAVKYGHELAKILFESVRLGLLSTNELIHEMRLLEQIPDTVFEESHPVQVDVSTNAAEGFQSAVQRVPQFTKVTPHGSVQIQLKQKQRAVGYQAMVYVCLPMDQILAMDGTRRLPGKAMPKETALYEFNRENAAFLLDIVEAFGLASKTHNRDIREILDQILAAAS